jgi:hypothetical protein
MRDQCRHDALVFHFRGRHEGGHGALPEQRSARRRFGRRRHEARQQARRGATSLRFGVTELQSRGRRSPFALGFPLLQRRRDVNRRRDVVAATLRGRGRAGALARERLRHRRRFAQFFHEVALVLEGLLRGGRD